MKQALLIAGFGTSIPQAFEQEILPTVDALTHAAGDLPVYTAFTSPTIRRIWAGRGKQLVSVTEALEQMLADGVEDVFLQPIHLIPGFEYDRVRADAEAFRERFASLKIGFPLLYTPTDLNEVARMISDHFPVEADRAIVLLGHGTEHAANRTYPALQTQLERLCRRDILIGTVEGEPGQTESLGSLLRLRGFHKVLLAPLLLVAGDHARNDIGGDDVDSRASLFRAMGFSVSCRLEGLGRCEAVHRLFVHHLNSLLES